MPHSTIDNDFQRFIDALVVEHAEYAHRLIAASYDAARDRHMHDGVELIALDSNGIALSDGRGNTLSLPDEMTRDAFLAYLRRRFGAVDHAAFYAWASHRAADHTADASEWVTGFKAIWMNLQDWWRQKKRSR